MVPSSASSPAAERLVHERLDAYQVSLEFLTLAHDLVRRLPRTKGQLGDQLERAAESIVLRIAESAGAETGSPLQRAGFRAARGSALECSAALDIAHIRGVAPAEVLGEGRGLLVRLVQMLTRLARER